MSHMLVTVLLRPRLQGEELRRRLQGMRPVCSLLPYRRAVPLEGTEAFLYERQRDPLEILDFLQPFVPQAACRILREGEVELVELTLLGEAELSHLWSTMWSILWCLFAAGLTRGFEIGQPAWICLAPLLLLPLIGGYPALVLRWAQASFRRKLKAVPLPAYCDGARCGRKSR